MYVLKDADEGVCPRCNRELKLLTHKKMPDGYPAFLICFGCEDVVEVDGDDGETVEYKRGRRKKYTKEHKREKPSVKQIRQREYSAERGRRCEKAERSTSPNHGNRSVCRGSRRADDSSGSGAGGSDGGELLGL